MRECPRVLTLGEDSEGPAEQLGCDRGGFRALGVLDLLFLSPKVDDLGGSEQLGFAHHAFFDLVLGSNIAFIKVAPIQQRRVVLAVIEILIGSM